MVMRLREKDYGGRGHMVCSLVVATGVGVWQGVGQRQIHPSGSSTDWASELSPEAGAMWDARERAQLRTLIEAARRELREREPEDVPAKLRKVAASSARTLPPPLERALVATLVSDEAFRKSAGTRLTRSAKDDPIAHRFVDDPVDAHRLAAESVEHEARESQAAMASDATIRIELLEEQLAEAKERNAALRTRFETRIASQREADRAARAQLVERALRDERHIEQMERKMQSLMDERDAVSEHARTLDARVDRLAEALRSSAHQPRPRLVSAPVTVTDPIDLSRHLDRLERMARPYRTATRPADGTDASAPFALPAGVPPDVRGAIDAVVGLEVDQIVIDGYNLAGIVAEGAFHTRVGRDRVESIASALHRRSSARVIVVFDAVDVEGRGSVRSDRGVEIVFTHDRSADDEIAEIVSGMGARTVVVTNDRELRERCSAAGAVVVWSDALASWANP